MNKITLSLLLLFSFALQAKTVLRKENNRWHLLVDEQPFAIKGVTFGEQVEPATIGRHLKDLQFLGVNTIRTWGTDEHTQVLLDSAQAYGIKVMVGIWLRHGRPGMEGDDRFDYLRDTQGMDEMHRDAMATVKRYKDHPALLFFGVGNEVFLNIATDAEKKAYAQFLETLCRDIKVEDPDHPVCSVEAWTFGLPWWKEYCPSVDVYGLNVYGAGANDIPDALQKAGIDKPYVITEFGVRGEWEVPKDKNGLLIEPNDTEKYDVIAKGYRDWIASKDACLGVYMFHYEHKENFGAVWLLMYYGVAYRPAYWATREAFTGQLPLNRIPVWHQFELPDVPMPAGTWVKVSFDLSDEEDDALDISFHYNQRTGSRARRDQINALASRGNRKDGFEILLPEETGLLKVYAFAKDAYGNLGIAQTSLLVKGKDDKLIPGAKTILPFYVYKDGKEQPYTPSAYMGDLQFMRVDAEYQEVLKSGRAALRISYGNGAGWWGLGFVDPANDWGDRAGGYDLRGAKLFSFWAKASSPDVDVTIGYGLIDNNKAYYDTDKRSKKITLSTEWKKYDIKIPASADLRCVKSGLVLYGGAIGKPYSVYVDEVRFE